MWLEPYKDKYRAFERYTDPYTGKTKRASTIIDRDTKAARKAAESVLRGIIEAATQIKQDEDITLAELSKKYLEHQTKTTKPQTVVRDRTVSNSLIRAIGPDVLVNRMTARFVDEKLQKTGKPNVTLNTYLELFKRMMRWAYSSDYVADISYLVKLKQYPDKEKKERIKDKYMNSDELVRCLNAMKFERWRLLTHFLALSGLRIGEAIALNDSDVTDYITVNKTLDPKTGSISVNAKTDAGNREVYIQPELEDVVKQIRSFVRVESFRIGYRSDLFFPDQSGEYINYYSYNKYLKQITGATIGRQLTPHALRHTHVSLLAEQGYSLEAISRRVGHEDSKITKEIYLHVTQNQKEKDRKQLEGIRLLQ